jgi:hypothetical protein
MEKKNVFRKHLQIMVSTSKSTQSNQQNTKHGSSRQETIAVTHLNMSAAIVTLLNIQQSTKATTIFTHPDFDTTTQQWQPTKEPWKQHLPSHQPYYPSPHSHELKSKPCDTNWQT